ncbi:MAG: DUF2141 domain-containing protein [Myxococcota bacterium]
MRILVVCVVGVFGFGATAAAAPETEVLSGIVIDVANLQSSRGEVYCTLYRSAKGFPTEPQNSFKQSRVRVVKKKAQCRFPSVKPGRYAVAVWHDEDGDQELDSNWIGIPKEPVGASNDAEASFGPPSFDDAVFDFRAPLFRQTVRVE